MASCVAFSAPGLGASGFLRTLFSDRHMSCVCEKPSRLRVVRMLLPPKPHKDIEPPLSPEQVGPPGYEWDPNFPGTLKPGKVQDNYPLSDVLKSGVYENMKYEELDIDGREPQIFEVEEDLLEWLSRQGRLISREAEGDDELEMDVEKQVNGITEEDLEFGDDDSRTIAYYSKQGEGSAVGTGGDFGGFADIEDDAGF